MLQRITKEELRQLRNKIPIEGLIQKGLRLPSKICDGILRFECPLCQSFHTATNRETNLARCFDCQRNFNPIDIVMAARELTFRQSAVFLKRILTVPCSSQPDKKTPTSTGGLASIHEILQRVALSTGERK